MSSASSPGAGSTEVPITSPSRIGRSSSRRYASPSTTRRNQSEIGAALPTVCGASTRVVDVFRIDSESFRYARCGTSVQASVRMDCCGRWSCGSSPSTMRSRSRSAAAKPCATRLAPLPGVHRQQRVPGGVRAARSDPVGELLHSGRSQLAAQKAVLVQCGGGGHGRRATPGGEPQWTDRPGELRAEGGVVRRVEAEPGLVRRVVGVAVGDQALQRVVARTGEDVAAPGPQVLRRGVLEQRLLELSGEAGEPDRLGAQRGAQLGQQQGRRLRLGRAPARRAQHRLRSQPDAGEPDAPGQWEQVAHRFPLGARPVDGVPVTVPERHRVEHPLEDQRLQQLAQHPAPHRRVLRGQHGLLDQRGVMTTPRTSGWGPPRTAAVHRGR